MLDRERSNLLLIGLRGSGKSTLARLIAAELGRPAVDLDHVTPVHMGCTSVGEAWKQHGEAAFRAAETTALTETLGTPGRIVALGGGTPTAPGALELIQSHRKGGRALVVYLRCTPAELRRRLVQAGGAGTDRPSLTGGDPLAEIDAVYARRDPLYMSIADLVIDETTPAPQTAERIVEFLQGAEECPGD